jgi:hypothetical protein
LLGGHPWSSLADNAVVSAEHCNHYLAPNYCITGIRDFERGGRNTVGSGDTVGMVEKGLDLRILGLGFEVEIERE